MSIEDGTRWSVLNRDGFRCCYCGATSAEGARLEIDHVVPRSWGGTDDIANLRTSCRTCNRSKRATVAVPASERSDVRPATGAWPERFIWLRWGEWCLELSPTNPDWCVLIYRPTWIKLAEASEYYINRDRFDEPDWVSHIATKCSHRQFNDPNSIWNPDAAHLLDTALAELKRRGIWPAAEVEEGRKSEWHSEENQN